MHNYSADAEPSIQRCYFERMHLSIKKPSLKLYYNWTMCGRSFLISSDSYLNLWIYRQNSTDSWRTTRYDDRQSPRNNASKIQKLVFRCFLLTSAKAKKFQHGNRSIRLYVYIHCDFSATKKFFNNRHKILSEELTFCSAMGSTRSETKHSLTLRGKTDIHTQTDLNKIMIIDYDYYYYYY